MIEQIYNTLLGMINNLKSRKAMFLLDNRTLLQSTFEYDKSMIGSDK